MYIEYVCVWWRPDIRSYLFNNYFDSSIRTRNRTRPPGLRVQNIAYNGFYSFYIFAWKKSYDFSHYCCFVLCPRAQYTRTSLSTDTSTYLSSHFCCINYTYKKSEVDYQYTKSLVVTKCDGRTIIILFTFSGEVERVLKKWLRWPVAHCTSN